MRYKECIQHNDLLTLDIAVLASVSTNENWVGKQEGPGTVSFLDSFLGGKQAKILGCASIAFWIAGLQSGITLKISKLTRSLA